MTSQATEDRQVTPRRAQTRERIMAAALGVFAERGVTGASVEVICEAAGFTRGAFYSNFADKDALVLALLEAGTTEQFAAAERSLRDLPTALSGASFDDVVSVALGRLGNEERPSRASLLTQQELKLHAAHVPALWEPYTAFLDTRRAQLSRQVESSLLDAGLEFVLPFDQALDVLTGTHDVAQDRFLLGGAMDTTALRSVILAITRPATR